MNTPTIALLIEEGGRTWYSKRRFWSIDAAEMAAEALYDAGYDSVTVVDLTAQ